MNFINIHNHTHYSLLDALSRPKHLAKFASDNKQPAIALTDHGNLYGACEFFKYCKAEGVKPIIGCEVYVSRDRFIKDSTNRYSQTLLLYAKNHTGYLNLIELVTKSYLEGFYYVPRIDKKLLSGHTEGLVCVSSGSQGEICQYLLAENFDKALEVARSYKDLFEDYYLEILPPSTHPKQTAINDQIIQISKSLDLPVVIGCDSHYVNIQDKPSHDVLVCIQSGRNVDETDRPKYKGDMQLRTNVDIEMEFKGLPELETYMKNTLEFADLFDMQIEFGQNLLPKYDTPENEPADQYLRELCEQGLKSKYTEDEHESAFKRLNYELSVIESMGFIDYFLIVWDFVKFAKDKGIMVGPGRGSAAGSIIAYCLDITTVDPLKYGLYFERFLNPERVSMPDVDIDFADTRREEVMDYVVERYGRLNVAQIITFGTMSAKAVVRDVGRALGFLYADVDRIAKLVPPPVLGKYEPLSKSVEDAPDLSLAYKNEPATKRLMDYAIKLEGTVRHTGTHACAVIIAQEPLTHFTPMQPASGRENSIVTQYSMKPLEDIGLLKMDFLGLKNLTILEIALEIIKDRHDVEIDIDHVDLYDKKTFELFSAGLTTGVFQLESSGMKRYLKELRPSRLEDIIAMNALYRPGPMDYIPQYIQGKHDPKSIKYMDPVFEPILKETYGVGVYQEQILRIARDFAGFSLGEADLLRRAVGKKIPELLAEQKAKFIDGAQANGHDPKFAGKVFTDVIEPFAGYGFNKAHATCYAYIAYQTAYLKANYTVEFMAALLTADLESTDRVVIEIDECSELGIEVLPPDINESSLNFTVIDESNIRFGLGAIKGLGTKTVERIIEIRNESGPFESLEDFAQKIPPELLNKKSIQALSYAGAFDKFGSRHQIACSFELLNKYSKQHQTARNSGQSSLFDMFDSIPSADKLELLPVEPLSDFEILTNEKNVLGLYVSSHPLKGLGRYLSQKYHQVTDLNDDFVDKKIKMCGMITNYRKFYTKNGKQMMTFTLEDLTGSIDVVCFARNLNSLKDEVQPDEFFVCYGTVGKRDNLQLRLDQVQKVSLEKMKESALESNHFEHQTETFEIKIPKETSKTNLTQLKEVLSTNPGNTPVCLQMENLNGSIKHIKLKSGITLTPAVKSQIMSLLK
jgi:DNA polymerase III subunit alpha